MADPFNYYLYSRDRNPHSTGGFEDKLAQLDGIGKDASAAPAGMGAITALSWPAFKVQATHALVVGHLLRAHTTLHDSESMAGLGVSTTYYPPETTNLGLGCSPTPGLCIWKCARQPLVPYSGPARAGSTGPQPRRRNNRQTIALGDAALPATSPPGVDIVVHSGTKYIAGTL